MRVFLIVASGSVLLRTAPRLASAADVTSESPRRTKAPAVSEVSLRRFDSLSYIIIKWNQRVRTMHAICCNGLGQKVKRLTLIGVVDSPAVATGCSSVQFRVTVTSQSVVRRITPLL